jgi:hypothetical protein
MSCGSGAEGNGTIKPCVLALHISFLRFLHTPAGSITAVAGTQMASLTFVGLELMLAVTCFRVAFWAGQIASLSTSRNSA